MRRPLRLFVTGACVAMIATILTPAPVMARAPQDPAPPPGKRSTIGKTLVFLGGAATGLVVHESGHVLLGASFGAHPRVRPIHFGGIPFFTIDHDTVTRRKEFVISSAGFWMQYLSSEWILSARPNLRREHARFLEGMLAFHVGTSIMYSVAAFGQIGPLERDTRGIADSLGHHGVREPLVGLLVLAPALLDGYRYLRPEARWAAWTSRGIKMASVVLTIGAGRD